LFGVLRQRRYNLDVWGRSMMKRDERIMGRPYAQNADLAMERN
jgi:hypothetical protein